MTPEEPRARRKLPLVKLAMAAAVVAGAGFLVLRGVNYRDLGEHGFSYIRAAGPWVFFSAAAILPAFSAPLSAFSLTAGEAFGRQMTMPGVIAAMMAAMAFNMAFTYWLARYALHPLLSRVTEHYGYTIPRVTRENAVAIALVLRLTPGPPFFMQSYILGLAHMPFRLYMVVSFLSSIPMTVALVILGKGVFNGNLPLVLTGAGVIVAASAGVHWMRKRYAARAA
jgi:uncharacterized membrane protein YdjX (TVP38/TMEM64 family)